MLTFYKTGREKGTFDTGVQLALRRILASPTFVFRVEEDAAVQARHSAPGQRSRAGVAAVVLPVEQHSRRAAARAGATKGSSVSRRCSNGKYGACSPTSDADALVSNFTGQWLQVRNLEDHRAESRRVPGLR